MITLGVLACIGATLGLVAGGFSKDYQAARQAVIPTIMPQLIFAGYLIPKVRCWFLGWGGAYSLCPVRHKRR